MDFGGWTQPLRFLNSVFWDWGGGGPPPNPNPRISNLKPNHIYLKLIDFKFSDSHFKNLWIYELDPAPEVLKKHLHICCHAASLGEQLQSKNQVRGRMMAAKILSKSSRQLSKGSFRVFEENQETKDLKKYVMDKIKIRQLGRKPVTIGFVKRISGHNPKP